MLKEEIALLKSAKHRHYLLIGLLFYMLLVAVPLFSGTLYLCMLINNPWILFMAFITGIFLGYLLSSTFYLVRDWAETASQAMCEPLRELLEMAEAHEADRRELRQEEEAIRRAQERRRFQEQIRQRLREMAGRGRDAEGLNSQNFSSKIP
jgi:type VI protein secretion system component VasK